ncbi:Acetylornithine deacetylase, Succinyl-diaminopimelate desuccinylase, deacylase [Enterococcus mundtii 3F]|uniref:Sapep family Mn(2+)-dependent dipeptidase n=1 Tax=Enterococcus mundtii TaxID=53346 RepID=UPI00230319B1|nr:Sapep family Mn(2+)-dependent dipeptidase [Enterococcus mundtii]MDA9462838.1 Acetylornithine deacetylase, Succinyl-diaminopimelate desuccinylase, deacylase [Enterococcus mundtii 3F]
MDQINTAIEENWLDFLDLLKQVMQVPSVKSEAGPGAPFGKEVRSVLSLVMNKSAGYGFQTKVIDDAIGYAQWGDEGSDHIGVLGHLDVVPAGQGWEFPPFDLSEKNGRFYGRGILDNKGPIMCCLYGMKLLKELGHQPKKNLRIIFGTDEESGMSDIPHYLAEESPPSFGFTPDCKYPVVYGERGIVNVVLHFTLPEEERQQISRFEGDQFRDHVPDQLHVRIAKQEVSVSGKRAPSNAPELGENAITILATKLAEGQTIPPIAQNYFRWISQSLHQKHFGEGVDLAFEDEDSGKLILTPVVLQKSPEGMLLEIAFRYPVTVSEKQVVSRLKSQLPLGVDLEVIRSIPGFCRTEESKKIATLSTIYHQVTGNDPKPVTTTGATYARKMPNILAFGPSFPGQKGIAHTANEYMDVADLRTNLEIYMRSLQALTE